MTWIYKVKKIQTLGKNEDLGEHSHPRRAAEYKQARQCIRECLIELKQESDTVEIKNHLHIQGHPEQLVSLSHTKTHAIAMMGLTPSYKSIGVDIERLDRPIKKESQKYFEREEDEFEHPTHRNLYLWCIKEACFKALSPLIQGHGEFKVRQLLLKDIWVSKNKFGYSDEIFGTFETEIVEFDGNDFLVSFAFI
jgi:4'-phosphopantetheinyl transferase EntD